MLFTTKPFMSSRSPTANENARGKTPRSALGLSSRTADCVKSCHFEAKPRNLSFYVLENARSLTPFEMTNWRQDEFSHSLTE